VRLMRARGGEENKLGVEVPQPSLEGGIATNLAFRDVKQSSAIAVTASAVCSFI